MTFDDGDKHNLSAAEWSLIDSKVRPKKNRTRRIWLRIALGAVQLILLVFICIYVVFPLIYKFSYSLQRSSVFRSRANIDADSNFKHPSIYGFEGARNFYLDSDDGVRLGVWHILPENRTIQLDGVDTDDSQQPYPDVVVNSGQDIVIYCHGNAGNRVNDYRLALYRVLRKYFHVITFDYRSYGDSSEHEPTESKVIEDAVLVYSWFANKTTGNIFVWGHSLGSSIAIQTVNVIQQRNIKRPVGLVLESPFNNMMDEIGEFPVAKYFRFLPWFRYTVIDPMLENGFRFTSDQHICKVNAPILFLHAEDDTVVPYKLGRKLYEAAQTCRDPSQGSVSFKAFEGRHQYNHRYINRSPELPDVIKNFVAQALAESGRL